MIFAVSWAGSSYSWKFYAQRKMKGYETFICFKQTLPFLLCLKLYSVVFTVYHQQLQKTIETHHWFLFVWEASIHARNTLP